MSAKGRRAGVPVPHEYYPTPSWCVARLVERLVELYGASFVESFDEYVEPAIGDGAICRAWAASVGVSTQWVGNDIRNVRPALDMGAARLASLHQGDAVAFLENYRARDKARALCCTNPPFSLSLSLAAAAVPRFGLTAFLLRTGITGGFSDNRDVWFRANRPNVFILPERPSFDGEGTDSATYAWFAWGCPTHEPIDWLARTPESDRRADAHHARMRVQSLRRELMEDPPLTEQPALF